MKETNIKQSLYSLLLLLLQGFQVLRHSVVEMHGNA